MLAWGKFSRIILECTTRMLNIQNFKKSQNGISRCSERAYLVDSGRCDKQALLIFVDGAGAENLGCQCQLVFCEQKNALYCFVC